MPANKQVTVERTWQLVQFEPFRVVDTISEIPDIILSNPEAMKLIRYLQLVDIEWTYIQYAKLRASIPKLTSLEAIAKANDFLEQERRDTFEALLKSISDKPGEEENKSK